MIVKATKDLEQIREQSYNSSVTDLTEKLKQCLYHEQDNKWELCSICYEIKHQREWERKGYRSLREYINDLRSKSYNIDQKTFSEYVRIRKLIITFEIKKDFFMEVGYSKFRELSILADKVTKEQMLDFLSKLPFISVRELKLKKKEILKAERQYEINNRESTTQHESISYEDIREMTESENTEEIECDYYTCEETSWGVEYGPNMKYYTFDAFGREIIIVEKALTIAQNLSNRRLPSKIV